jgi:hypothetical protein
MWKGRETSMRKRTIATLLVSHIIAVGAGFAAGIYLLPILIAPPAPDRATVARAAENSEFVGEFARDRADSDALHWGEGEISIGRDVISFVGELAPGPDYRLYLSPEFVETEADFKRLKSAMVQVGEVKTFENFIVPLPDGIDPSKYNALIVWCETFAQYITSGSYERRPK